MNVIKSLERALDFEKCKDANIRFSCGDGEVVTKSVNFKLHSRIIYVMLAQLGDQSLHDYCVACVVLPDIKKDILIHLTNIISNGTTIFSKSEFDANVIAEVIKTAQVLGIDLNNYGVDSYQGTHLKHIETQAQEVHIKKEEDKVDIDSVKVKKEIVGGPHMEYFETPELNIKKEKEDKIVVDVKQEAIGDLKGKPSEKVDYKRKGDVPSSNWWLISGGATQVPDYVKDIESDERNGVLHNYSIWYRNFRRNRELKPTEKRKAKKLIEMIKRKVGCTFPQCGQKFFDEFGMKEHFLRVHQCKCGEVGGIVHGPGAV